MSNPWYDYDRVNRFIMGTLKEGQEPVTEEDVKAAAYALLAVFQGQNILKDMGVEKKRGERGAEFKIDEYTIDHQAMGIVMEWRSGGLKYQDALNEFMRITGAKTAAAKNLMRDLRPRAEKTIKALDQMYAHATGTQPPDRKF